MATPAKAPAAKPKPKPSSATPPKGQPKDTPKAAPKAAPKTPAKAASKAGASAKETPAKAVGAKAVSSSAKAPPAASPKAASPKAASSKVTAKVAAKVAGDVSGKVSSSTKSGKSAKAAAPEKNSKAAAPANSSNAAKEAAPAKAEKSKKPSTKRGPIDLSTAKSVAAVAAASQADSSGYVVINGRRVRMISTKGLPAPKRPKIVVEKEAEKPEIQISSIKTKLTKKELEEYRCLLLEKRRQIIGTISGLEDEALRSSGGNLSNMPLHMADIGSDTFDQDFTLGMAQTERQTLSEIDAALQRIENKTYGICQLTGKPIPKARLDAKPWAKFSIEAAKLVELGMAPR
jgi:RNA polymerase-binding transcription factor DksA